MRPLHVTFTGLDGATRAQDLLALSRDFPIEWGILFHPTREGSGRYPALAQIRSVAECDLKISAHLCGGYTMTDDKATIEHPFGARFVSGLRKAIEYFPTLSTPKRVG